MVSPTKLIGAMEHKVANDFLADNSNGWPPVLSEQETTKAAQAVKEWTSNADVNMANWLGCSTNLTSRVFLLGEYAQALLDADLTRRFTPEARDTALFALQITRASYKVARDYMDVQAGKIFPFLEKAIAQIEEREEDRYTTRIHDGADDGQG